MMQQELLEQYIESLKSKIERIDSLLAKFNEGNSKAGDNIRLLAHTLHGSGASFGFPEISEAGKNAELAPKEELAEKLAELKKVLQAAVARSGQNKALSTGKADAVAGIREQNTQRTTASPVKDKNANSDPATAPLKILIVDDDPLIANSVKHALSGLSEDQQCVLVETAAQAQEVIVKQVFDLIVMDLLLPDRDGRELIEQIKQEFRIQTPLLVLSGLQNDSVRIECMGLGADKYLSKPFYEDVLLGEVKKLLGKNTRKKLSLVPMDGETVEAGDDHEARPAYLVGKSILIAEDDKMQAELIKQRLTEEGASVIQASNGREAMQQLRSREFSLLILDVKMPVMDGFEVMKRIREELHLEMPVIMVTAMGSEDDIVRGYDLGATDYILKPYSEVQLFARVKSLLKAKIKSGSATH